MSAVPSPLAIDRIDKLASSNPSAWKVWSTALLAAICAAWPLLVAAIIHGPQIMIRSLAGDSYHYLAIARKAHIYGIYTYDGVHVTNGFHPLWQYTLRGLFAVLHLESHEAQAVGTLWLALIAISVGIALASAAVVRITGERFLGLLLVPGLYYLAVGVHVRNLSIWAALDGMEPAFSVLFCGIFFYLVSHFIGVASKRAFDVVNACRALGFVLPFIILSRLDDVFLLPAFLVALFFFESSWRKRITAALWIVSPSAIAVLGYMIYNTMTVGAAMPLSGRTKAGFAGFLSAYLMSAIHFPPILELKAYLTRKPSDAVAVFANSFRFVELLYPFLAAAFGAFALWKFRRHRPEYGVYFAVCLYILLKVGYNFLNVHPWHQADWYYTFAVLCLSVLGGIGLQGQWRNLNSYPVARKSVVTVYVCVMMLAASQVYVAIVFQRADDPDTKFWERHAAIRQQLVSHGVTGVINVDDGITAFLLDLPMMHGFAFATDVEAQRTHTDGHMLALAYSRGINTITGFDYLYTDNPPHTQAEIESYLKASLFGPVIKNEIDQFDYKLAYYDPVLKLPFISFSPKPH
jgi:hypothetical protein